MRVLIVLGRGDVSCRGASVIAALRAQGHDVDVIPSANGRPGRPGPAGRPLRRGDSVVAAYRRLRARLPAKRRMAAELRRRRPHVVVACPLTNRFTQGHLHAATRLGIPTVGMLTWEDGSAGEALATLPDAVLVWSPRLARQARAAHAIPRDRLVVTGAAAFDDWFARQPATSRREVCARLGVDPGSPYVLHAVRPRQSPAAADLRTALAAEHRTPGLEVAVAPSSREDPHGLFDAVFHAAAVAGADPLAFVAAAIADRPCVMVAAERRRAQEPVKERLAHLVKGRFIEIVPDSRAAATALADVVEGRDPRAPMRRRFLSTFIRPVGLDRPAGEVVAHAIVQTAARGVRPPEPVLPSRRAALPGRVKVGKVRQPPTEEEERSALLRLHDQHPIPVRQPLALVAQLAGTGGDRLIRLLDAHPQVHARAGRLRPGGADPPTWPRVNLAAGPDGWWDTLREPAPAPGSAGGPADDRPFLFSPTLQRRVFDHCVASWRIERQRDVLDAFMTAYFNAWLDYQSLYGDDQRWVCASGGALGLQARDRAGFFGDYPDGRLVVVVEPQVAGDEAAARRWTSLAEMLVQARADEGERLLVIDGRELATAPEPVMRDLARWLGIDFDPRLCEATFNRMAARAPASLRPGGADGPAGELYERLVSAGG